MNNSEEWHLLAGYWETRVEDDEGWAKEVAVQNRNHFLRLLGLISIKGGQDGSEDTSL